MGDTFALHLHQLDLGRRAEPARPRQEPSLALEDIASCRPQTLDQARGRRYAQAIALPFQDAGIATWAYFCCSPRGRYVQRLLDTPLHKTRMIGATWTRRRAASKRRERS